jgi:hypothetical protein
VCIQGEWTHVRHIRPGLFGNFHTSTFDSLMCACLPCAENPDSPGVIGALCNPGDRICGPEPRRAPDNKICFSGVGKYAESKGKRTDRAVIFRTDVEDRSEPGGEPPTIRPIGIGWVCGSSPRPTVMTSEPEQPEQQGLRPAPAGGLRRSDDGGSHGHRAGSRSAPTPDIDDGGDPIHGNQQIHPPQEDPPVRADEAPRAR